MNFKTILGFTGILFFVILTSLSAQDQDLAFLYGQAQSHIEHDNFGQALINYLVIHHTDPSFPDIQEKIQEAIELIRNRITFRIALINFRDYGSDPGITSRIQDGIFDHLLNTRINTLEIVDQSRHEQFDQIAQRIGVEREEERPLSAIIDGSVYGMVVEENTYVASTTQDMEVATRRVPNPNREVLVRAINGLRYQETQYRQMERDQTARSLSADLSVLMNLRNASREQLLEAGIEMLRSRNIGSSLSELNEFIEQLESRMAQEPEFIEEPIMGIIAGYGETVVRVVSLELYIKIRDFLTGDLIYTKRLIKTISSVGMPTEVISRSTMCSDVIEEIINEAGNELSQELRSYGLGYLELFRYDIRTGNIANAVENAVNYLVSISSIEAAAGLPEVIRFLDRYSSNNFSMRSGFLESHFERFFPEAYSNATELMRRLAAAEKIELLCDALTNSDGRVLVAYAIGDLADFLMSAQLERTLANYMELFRQADISIEELIIEGRRAEAVAIIQRGDLEMVKILELVCVDDDWRLVEFNGFPRSLPLGQSLTVELDGAESHLYSIDVTEQCRLKIFSIGGSNAVGELLDSECRSITRDNEDGYQPNFEIQRDLEPSIYYLLVSNYGSHASSSLNLTAERLIRGGGACSNAQVIEIGRDYRGNAQGTTPTYYSFVVRHQSVYKIFTRSRVNTVGTLLDEYCNVIAANDDCGSDSDFMIHRILEPGTYYLTVGGLNDNAQGRYRLRVERSNDLVFFENIRDIQIGDLFRDDLARAGHNIYRFEIASDEDIRVFSTGDIDVKGELLDENMCRIAFDDDSGEGLNFLIEAYLIPGIYHIHVSGYTRWDYGRFSLHTVRVMY